MRKNYILIFLLINLFSSCALFKKSTKSKPIIKKIRLHEHYTKDNAINLSRDSVFKFKYLTTEKYTKNGSLLERFSFNSKRNIVTKSVFTHNSFNKFLTNHKYKNDSVIEKSYYYYNKNNKLAKVLSFNKDSVLITENYHKYRNGNRVGLKGVFHKHNAGFESVMTYDKNNNLIKYTSSGFYGSNTERKYKHDKKGRVILELFNNGKNIVEEISKYDNQDNLIEVIRKDELAQKTTIFRYSYEYDNNLNWISKKFYYEGKLDKIVLREITYYD